MNKPEGVTSLGGGMGSSLGWAKGSKELRFRVQFLAS